MNSRSAFAPLIALALTLPLTACQPGLVPLAGARAPAPLALPESLSMRALARTAATVPPPQPVATAVPVEEKLVHAVRTTAATVPPPLPASRDWPDLTYLRSRQLMVPVQGATVFDVTDSFDDARDGGERVHRAVDIRAPRGTPVIAADDGRILALKSNKLGGITVYATDPDQRLVYYFAHLDHYADGLAEGQAIKKGAVIGYVGTTGNAPKDVPHLHFQVMRMADAKRYWDGPVLDPRPYFMWDGGPGDAMMMRNGTR